MALATATPSLTDRFCVCNGAAIRFRVAGSGSPVMLVHGWTLDLEMWDRQVEMLRGSLCVIAFDRRGFGLSAGRPSIDQDCEDLQALCRHLALERVALVGMSQGARAVMRFAATAPDSVSCVVLDGPPDVLGAEAVDVRVPELTAPAPVSTAAPGPLPVECLAAPTLIVTGEHDAAERVETANALARRLPHAERGIIPDAGHLPNFDNPVAYTEMLRTFLERHAPAPH